MTKEEALTKWVMPAIRKTWNEKKCGEILEALKQEPKYCDHNICIRNEYNGIGCGECEVTKSQELCEDAISRQAVLNILDDMVKDYINENDFDKAQGIAWVKVQKLTSVSSSEKPTKWIPVKRHEITDEEREREGYPKEWACHLDSIMPYDGQRMLITTKGGFVELDECYSDDGCTFSLDSGYDWIDDVVAWCELPKPYKAESEVKE